MAAENLSAIDSVFRLVDHEVWIVTAGDANRHGGLVATWVSRASIDAQRPLAAVAIGVNHYTRELLDASGAFAVHLITADQLELVWRFGLGSGRDRDKLAELAWQAGETGTPVLADVLAWLECRTIHRFDAGDRIYYLGEVVAGRQVNPGKPLCEAELFSQASDARKAQLQATMEADLQVQRPLFDAWRERVTGR